MPKGFFPQQDTGRIIGSIQAEQDISFQLMQKKLTDYMKIIRKDPAVAHAVGVTGNTTTNAGNVYITLKPLSARKLSVDQVINRLRKKLAVVTWGHFIFAGGSGFGGGWPARECSISIYTVCGYFAEFKHVGA